MAKRPLLTLIDGHAVAYRAFHALPAKGFTNPRGEPTNAIYGFTQRIMDTLLAEPDYIAISFDRGMSGREDLHEAYKGTREKMPEALDIQIGIIERMAEAFNIPVLALDGYEADDVIGTVAQQAEEQGCRVRIITGDHDLLQLLTRYVDVQLPNRKKGARGDSVWRTAQFEERYPGLKPPQLVEYKGLRGDSSDNIPGVKGIGEKGALDLLSKFASLEDMYANLDAVDKRYREKLANEREMAFLSRQLATIMRDVPIELDLELCHARDFDPQNVIDMFDDLDFGRTIRDKLDKVIELNAVLEYKAMPIFVPPHEVVIEQAQLDALVEKLNAAEMIAFDTETTSIDPMQAELVGIALSVDGKFGYYIPVGHRNNHVQPTLFGDGDAPPQLPLDTVLEAIRPALTNPEISKVAHNANYDYIVMKRVGITVEPMSDDSMIAAWLLQPDDKLGLKDLAYSPHLGVRYKMQEITQLIGTGQKQITMDLVTIEKAAPYAAADAVVTYHLQTALAREMVKKENAKARELYLTMEIPLIPVIVAMEMAGIMVDREYLAQLSTELHEQQRDIEKQIFALAGEEFNVNSYQQLNTILFEKLKLPTEGLRKTKSGGFSLTAYVLDELAEREDHEILPLIMEFRSLGKLLGTYIDALPELIHPVTGRVHTSFNQTGAVTGRLSSSNPNLQNIPIRTEEGRRVRRAIIADEGKVLLSVDYSQIELRILAHYSGDDALQEAFRQNQDIHRATAAKVNGIAPEDVTFEQRRFAKSVNFGLMYGMGAFRLARDSDLMLAEAEAFIRDYFDTFPGVAEYLESTKEFVRESGYVQTLFGRRRYFPELTREGPGQARAEREAINMPIQGTAADILKKAMLELDQALQSTNAQMLLQVHDELVLELPEDDVEEVTPLVVSVMEAAGSFLKVPIVADAKWGKSWSALE